MEFQKINKYVIGVDLGSSATKTVLINEQGKTIATAKQLYSMNQPKNGWAEQSPQVWKEAVLSTIQEVVKKSGVKSEDILGIGLSGQMHGLVMLDEQNNLISDAIIWCDQRSSQEAEEMLDLMPMEKWIEISANPPLAGWTAAKIVWVRKNLPENYSRCKHILLPKDYIRYILTGKFATDVSDASGMQLLDVKNRCWSEEIINVLQIDPKLLADVYESQEITGYLLPEIADKCGLTVNCAVVAGGSDNACAGIGTGVVRQGQAFTSIGTSAVLYSHLDEYTEIPSGGLHLCCSAVPGCWHTMGGPQSGALSIEWFKNKFCLDLVEKAEQEGITFYDAMMNMVQTVPIGSEKLIYLPFLMGERTPHIDPLYRGAFLGLNVVHTQAHMLRAIMEGITYCLADCNNLLKEQGVSLVSVRACGGGSRSPVWRKMMAALYECEVCTLENEEGPAYGAAILAGTGVGIYSSVQDACDQFIKEKDSLLPDLEDSVVYKKFHTVYDSMCDSLRADFTALAKL
ncbi:xylulokinase [Apibacter sp. HY039]|uniref:xylulokinase n=1 Tax=Apibacter sp. HY039 TaxID=2501476 RepID=UPI000FEB60F2|nr:xylulokinase [Apibacter sp. HY039]